jgi:serine/threonine protein kinase
MNNSFAPDFLETFSEPDFLQLTSSRFDVLECIGDTYSGETYLLSEKDTETLYVLKAKKDSETLEDSCLQFYEAELLRGLEHKGLPVFDNVIERDGIKYVLRRYIEGEPLNKYLTNRSADPVQAINIILSLCDILNFLHSQPAPIIHRDIKPSNIIINPLDNSITLIDFGISRKYSENSDNDTTYLGTQKFAPPEQYGFAQTDCRTDIYSLGIVLRYWLTGAIERNAEIKDKALARIVAKSTALAPEMRYQSAAAFKKALNNYKNRTRRRVTALFAAALAACLVFITVFAILPGEIEAPLLPEENTTHENIADESVTEEPPLLFLEISADEFRELAENGYLSQYLRRSGEPELSYVDGEGLRISGRNNNWYAIDFNIDKLPPGHYILEVEFDSDEYMQFELANASAPYGGIVISEDGSRIIYNLQIVDVDGVSMTPTKRFFDDEVTYQQRLRLQTEFLSENSPPLPDFVVKSVKFYIDDSIPFEGSPLPFLEISADEFRELAENRHTDNLRHSGSSVLSFIDGKGLSVSNRRYTWDTVALKANVFPPGEYVLEVEMASDTLTQFVLENNSEPHGFFHMSGTPLTYELIRVNLEIVDDNGVSKAYVETSNGFAYNERIWSLQETVRMSTVWIGEDMPYPDIYIRSIKIYNAGESLPVTETGEHIRFVQHTNMPEDLKDKMILNIILNDVYDLSGYEYILADVKFSGENSIKGITSMWMVLYNETHEYVNNKRLTALGYAEDNAHRRVPAAITDRGENEWFTVWFPIHSAYAWDSQPDNIDITRIDRIRYQIMYENINNPNSANHIRVDSVPPGAVFTLANVRASNSRTGAEALPISIVGDVIYYSGTVEVVSADVF